MSRLSISSSFLVYCHLMCSLDGNLVKSLCLCPSILLSLSLSFSRCLSLSHCICFSLSLYLYVSPRLSVYLGVSLSLCHSLRLSPYPSLSLSLSLCIYICNFSIIVWLLCHAISWELRVVVARLMLVLYIM